MASLDRLSLNQITVERWNVEKVVDACVRHDIRSVALWRYGISATGLERCVQLVRDAGLRVTSVCRGGMFPAVDSAERKRRIEDNLRAVDEAAALNANSLVLVTGADPKVPLSEGRRMVADGIAEIVPYAAKCGVRLGVEPMHPIFAGDRSVINTIDQAMEIVNAYPADTVGIVLDVIHIWWDPRIESLIESCSGRILGFHVSDWPVPIPDPVKCRAMMGDGVIDIHGIRKMVENAGYAGPIEVEILNQTIWDEPGEEVITRMVERFERLV
jgi:sugar phosphate isomerase/epimerase